MSLLAAETHRPPGGAAHLVVLAGVVFAGLVFFAVSRWRRRREASATVDSTRSPEER